MRVSGTRYSRDARRLELAWKLIGFAARTPTIKRWSGLSTYQIRALYRSRLAADPSLADSPIYGTAPSQVGFFWQSALIKCEVAILAGLLRAFEVLPSILHQIEPEFLPGLVRGELLCHAYAEFRALLPKSRVTIEHAILLLTALVHGEEAKLGACISCRALVLVDSLALGATCCAYCEHEMRAGLSRAVASPNVSNISPDSDRATREKQGQSFERQGSLF